MNKSNPRLPGFTAEVSFYMTEESHYLSKNAHGFSTSLILTGCPGCAKFCMPCDKCLNTTSNPANCSSICKSCWACDCPPKWSSGSDRFAEWAPVRFSDVIN